MVNFIKPSFEFNPIKQNQCTKKEEQSRLTTKYSDNSKTSEH